MSNRASQPGRLLEIAYGDFDESDIVRLEDDYARAATTTDRGSSVTEAGEPGEDPVKPVGIGNLEPRSTVSLGGVGGRAATSRRISP